MSYHRLLLGICISRELDQDSNINADIRLKYTQIVNLINLYGGGGACFFLVLEKWKKQILYGAFMVIHVTVFHHSLGIFTVCLRNYGNCASNATLAMSHKLWIHAHRCFLELLKDI